MSALPRIPEFLLLPDPLDRLRELYRTGTTLEEQAVACLYGGGTAGERMEIADALHEAWVAIGKALYGEDR